MRHTIRKTLWLHTKTVIIYSYARLRTEPHDAAGRSAEARSRKGKPHGVDESNANWQGLPEFPAGESSDCTACADRLKECVISNETRG